MEYIESKKARPLTDIRYYLILVSAMLVFFLLFQPIRVQGSSMKNTLVDGDLLIMCRDWIVQGYEAGDIVVAAKDSFRNGECIIKRIIAVEGQTVAIDNETGMVYVDGQALDESYIPWREDNILTVCAALATLGTVKLECVIKTNGHILNVCQ